MSGLKNQAVADEQLREMAKETAKLMTTPFRLFKTALPEAKYTLSDVLQVGAMIISGANDSFLDKTLRDGNREFFEKLFNACRNPEDLEEFFYQKFVEDPSDAEQFVEDFAQIRKLNAGPDSGSLMMRKAVAEMLPKGKPGRPKQFNSETDGARLLSMSDEYLPFFTEFVQLQMKHPMKKAANLCDFLTDEYSQYAQAAKMQSEFIESIITGKTYQRIVRPKTRARKLADAMAGMQIAAMKAEYSAQIAAELRRAANRDSEEN